jgi:hypothetical protein
MASTKAWNSLNVKRSGSRSKQSGASPIRIRYNNGKPYKYVQDGAETANDQLLVARRLVEAGVRVVTVNSGRWDGHGGIGNPRNTELVRDHGPKFDQGFSALIEDLSGSGKAPRCSFSERGQRSLCGSR